MDDERRQLAAAAWGALLRTHARLVPLLDREMRESSGLALASYDVLLELAGAPDDRLRMSDLAERVTLSRTRVSRLVDQMAAEGLLSREGNPDDRRSSFATLTPRGREALRRAAPGYVSSIESQFAAALTTDDLRRLATMLGQVDGGAPNLLS